MRPNKFRTVEIRGKAYDLPKDMPLPRIGERVGVGNVFGVVSMVTYQFEDARDYAMIVFKLFPLPRTFIS